MSRPVLVDAVPMETRGLVSQMVVKVYYESIAFVGTNGGKRPLAVDANDGSCRRAIRIRVYPGCVEIVCHSRGVAELSEQQPRQTCN